ncbi:MAG: DUF4396 domain-containing protein [Candidatus Eisenbacteria bacterium]|nr:DUF4396 domain-containing protein [Candidatus Latescibacterota bacterium]MBD3302848.1 DUF4396 domain-containing protein [Candidatus Eisenbacteria bacterium]
MATSAVALALLFRDLRRKNPEIMPLMKAVWGLTVAYSGLLGLAAYFYSGRKQIARDSLARRGLRSTAHCYSGCGMGEIIGVLVTVGILAAAQPIVVAVTFSLAYVFGILLTVGPLMQEGIAKRTALKDAVISESASIVVMEAVAIGVDLFLAGDAGPGDTLFWSSLVVSLSLGFLAALPVNVLLVRYGVKEGMHDPRRMAEESG